MKGLWSSFLGKENRMGAFCLEGPVMSFFGQNARYEGYIKNVIVYRAVTLIARSFASVPWLLYENDKKLSTHPLLSLLGQINPYQSRSTFFESVVSYYLLTGNAFIEMIKDSEGLPIDLYSLRPDRVEIVPSEKGKVRAYCYRVDGRERWIPVEDTISPILHLKAFHPTHDWTGLSPLEAATQAIEQHNTVAAHNINLLKNGGRPTGALIVKTGAYGLSSEQREALRADMESVYKGTGNAGKIMVLEGDFDWKEMGMSPRDMDFVDGRHQSAREIAQAFGVPPMLVGVPGDATFANYREARYHLWEDTILPLLNHVIAEFNVWLTPRFGEELRLSYDAEAIPALAPRREAVWERVSKASFLSENEKRQILGIAF